jgi:alkanesulfonate monooxygenase SsuD/methylene tetrahydromethanopterin reductase-like flavin-dependent oxidoreductase (luciferase family)
MLASGPFFKSAEEVRNRLAIGTPDQVAERLELIASWGVTHLICSINSPSHTVWSDSALDLLVRDVLPRLRAA